MLKDQIRKQVEELIRRSETGRLEVFAVKLDELLTGKELKQEDLLRLILHQIRENKDQKVLLGTRARSGPALNMLGAHVVVPAGGSVRQEVTPSHADAFLPRSVFFTADKNLYDIELTSADVGGMAQTLTALQLSTFSTEAVDVSWAPFSHNIPLQFTFSNRGAEDVRVYSTIYGEQPPENNRYSGIRDMIGTYGSGFNPGGTGGRFQR